MQPTIDYTVILKKTLQKKKEIPDVDPLWLDFTESHSISARNALIHQYLPYVKQIAGRMSMGLADGVELGDLVSAGIVGLIDAIDRFDPFRGIKFETFAYTRIKGAIVDELRKYDWFPRSVRSKNRQLEEAIDHLETRLQRYPTDEEIAEHLGISLDELYKIIRQVNTSYIISLDDREETISDDRPTRIIDQLVDESQLTAEEKITRRNVQFLLRKLIDELPETEKLVLALYYYEGLTLKEIGAVLGVSESRVSQIHGKVIAHLRCKLKQLL